MQHNTQTIELPLRVGSRVTLWKTSEDDDEFLKYDPLYEGYVEQYVPETGKLRMSGGIGLDEFHQLVEEADGYEVIEEKN